MWHLLPQRPFVRAGDLLTHPYWGEMHPHSHTDTQQQGDLGALLRGRLAGTLRHTHHAGHWSADECHAAAYPGAGPLSCRPVGGMASSQPRDTADTRVTTGVTCKVMVGRHVTNACIAGRALAWHMGNPVLTPGTPSSTKHCQQ